MQCIYKTSVNLKRVCVPVCLWRNICWFESRTLGGALPSNASYQRLNTEEFRAEQCAASRLPIDTSDYLWIQERRSVTWRESRLTHGRAEKKRKYRIMKQRISLRQRRKVGESCHVRGKEQEVNTRERDTMGHAGEAMWRRNKGIKDMRAECLSSPGPVHSRQRDKRVSHIFKCSVYTNLPLLLSLPSRPTRAKRKCFQKDRGRESFYSLCSAAACCGVALPFQYQGYTHERCARELRCLPTCCMLTAACLHRAQGMPLDSPQGSSCWEQPPGHCHRETYLPWAPHPPEEETEERKSASEVETEWKWRGEGVIN